MQHTEEDLAVVAGIVALAASAMGRRLMCGLYPVEDLAIACEVDDGFARQAAQIAETDPDYSAKFSQVLALVAARGAWRAVDYAIAAGPAAA